jgi:glucose/mannose-6-phosphate isomerase
MVAKKIINLDDFNIYRKYDPAGMLTHIHNFPEMCRQAWKSALDFKLPEEYSRVKKVLVLGMGGSAICGDLAASLALKEASLPVLACRDYFLPQYVDEDTLVIASSYSGMTEETLSAFQQVFNIPAKALAITTGGKLLSLCGNMGVPAFTFDYKSQPRAALPFSLFATLAILHNLNILKIKSSDIEESFSNLKNLAEKINESVPADINPAKLLARKLVGKMVLIYGAGITAEVAHRWKTQINENSKTTAFYETFSELNHNAIVGYEMPEQTVRRLMVVMLDSNLLHERIRVRYGLTQQLLTQAGIDYHVLKGEGTNALGQMITLILFGDYVSYYLAMLNRQDPTVIKAIDFLKKSLSNR